MKFFPEVPMQPVLSLVVALAAAPALAQAPSVPPSEHPVLREIVGAVSADKLKAIDTQLVGFGTRHTLSETASDTHGLGAARRWVKSQFEEISRDCGGCLETITPSQVFTGARMPKAGTEVMDVVAIQKGSDPNRYLVMTAHLDSRVSNIMNSTADAPGADDDGSGVSALIEAARVLSKYKFAATIVYSADSGEEQGLYGGKLIADYAKAHGWNVEADLNNDMIGSTHGSSGVIDNVDAHIFSEGIRDDITPEQLMRLRYNGGLVDSPSRNVARYIAKLANAYIPNFHLEIMYRTDRFDRGGDHVMFNRDGYPAVRFTEVQENWQRQHQDVRRVDGVQYGDLLKWVDFGYVAKMTAANAIALASLAWAPAPPTDVKISGALTPDTTVSWQAVPNAAGYR
ncbi:MAG: M28 family peptidase, partial [Gammaproteobacteria bacterium]